MKVVPVFLYFVACCLALVYAECPNACSAHGRCGAYDMCICYRNWMANDCSERVCQFAKAHVDSPKGDLDASSGKLTGPAVTVVTNDVVYPYGTTEQYPSMVDTSGNIIQNTAHAYAECANKGICDRTAGVCGCFPGYEGSACQRASCPISSAGYCSGHGTCQSIAKISSDAYLNVYDLWDEGATMGCVCDAGYKGADCSLKECKSGVDPLYHGDYNTVRYPSFTYLIYSSNSKLGLTGNYSLTFYDWHGQAWYTDPIDSAATCLTVIQTLEKLPNGVVPLGTVRCSNSFTKPGVISADSTYSIIRSYTLVFTGNPGKLKPIDLNIRLDGTRPTLYFTDDATTSSLGYAVYPNGYAGENTDVVPDLCTGVLVTLDSATNTISTLSAVALVAFQKCLADSDGDVTNNVGAGYSWDYGNSVVGSTTSYYMNPHLIKLIDATQDLPESLSAATKSPNLESVTVPGLNDQVPSFYFDTNSRLNASTYIGGLSDFVQATYNSEGYGSTTISGNILNADPPGFYAVVVFDGTNFNIITNLNSVSSTIKYHVYTTTGYLQLVSPAAVAVTMSSDFFQKRANYFSNTVFLAPSPNAASSYYGNLDCESLGQSPNYPYSSGYVGAYTSLDCLQKGDMVMLLNTDITNLATNPISAVNPAYSDLYTVQKVSIEPYTTYEVPSTTLHTPDEEVRRRQLVLDYGVNQVYGFSSDFISYAAYTVVSNAVTFPSLSTGGASVYKFYPPTGFNYVGECANRGICDNVQGVCNCFAGSTSDNCAVINSLAL